MFQQTPRVHICGCFFWSIIWEKSFRSRFSASLFSFVLFPRLSRIRFVSLCFCSCLFNSFILCSIHSCGENTVFFSDNKHIPLWFLCLLHSLWLWAVNPSLLWSFGFYAEWTESPSSDVMDPFRNRERLRVEKWKGFPGNCFGFTKMLYLVAVFFFQRLSLEL